MTNQDRQDLTGMLAARSEGDAAALDQLVEGLYLEPRRMAHRKLRRRRPGESLESAALAGRK